MVSSLVIATLALARFEGGDARELALTLFEESKQPVAIAVYENKPYKAFEFQLEDSYTFLKALETATGLKQSPGVLRAYSDRTLPRNLIELDPVFRPATAQVMPGFDPGQVVVDGSATVKTPKGSAFDRTSLEKIRFSKALKIHWTLDHQSIAAFTSSIPERDFLQLIAKASGTLLLTQKEAYVLDLDPAEFRFRAQNTMKMHASSEAFKRMSDGRKMAFEMTQFALNVADNASIKRAFEVPGSSATIPLGASGKQSLYAQLSRFAREASTVQNQSARQPRSRELQQSADANASQASARVPGFVLQANWNADVAIVLRSNFQVRVLAYAATNRNRPPRQISLDFGRG